MKNNFLDQVVNLLNKKSAISFEIYKNTTIGRRVKKRMDALGIESQVQYLQKLKNNQNELEILKQAIFINVSYYFRDKTVFNYLEKQILPTLLQDKTKHVKRFWVAGCATGEEVFSLAMLLLEIIEKHNLTNCQYKILASDIDESALNKARTGIYTPNDIAKLPANYKAKYFAKNKNQYIIKQILRKNVIFAKQDLFRDPPFGAIDLILCRNVLIYIDNKIQETILKKLKFSLNINGHLLLGSSESPTFIKKYFKIVDNKLKIFKKINENDNYKKQINAPKTIVKPTQIKQKSEIKKMKNSEINNFKNFISQKYEPAIFIINKNLQIHYITNAALSLVELKQYLNEGTYLNEILPSDLCVVIKTAIIDIENENKAYKYPKYVLPNNTIVDITCEKIEDYSKTKNLFTILLKPTANKNTQQLDIKKINQLLKKELQLTEINLKESIQALEKSNQNFQSYNEELQSTNEEYLSVNEELQSINAEYQNSINDLSQANHYLDSLMESTQIATLFLDHKLKIKKFTKPISKLLNITEKDVDRPVYHFTHNFINDNWQKVVGNFLKKNTPVDEEFLDQENNYYLLKVRNLILTDSKKPGASVSFININKLKIAEQEIKQNVLLFKSIFEESTNGIIIYDTKNLKALQVNKAALKLFGYTKKQFLAKPTLDLYSHYKKNKLSTNAKQNLIYKLLTKTPKNSNELTITLANKKLLKVKNKIIQLNAPYSDFSIHIINHENINNDAFLRQNSLFNQIFHNSNEAVVLFETKTKRIIDINKAQEQLFGYSKNEYQKILEIDLLADLQHNNFKKENLYQKVTKKNFNKKVFTNKWFLKRKDKTTFEATVETKRLEAPFEEYSINITRPFTSVFKNVLQNLNSLFSFDSGNTPIHFLQLKLNGTFLNCSDSFLKLTGYTKKELQTLKLTQIVEPKANLLSKTEVTEKSISRKLITKNKEIKYCNFYSKRFFTNEKAKIYNVLITERTEDILKQQALTKKINQFNLQFTGSPLAILTIDQYLNILSANKEFFQLFGYTENEINKLNIKHIIDFDFLYIFNDRILKLKNKQQKSTSQQYSFVTKNGELLYCKVFLTTNKIQQQEDEPQYDVFLINVTEEVAKQQQVNDLKNKYKSIFNDSLIGQAIFDTNSKLQTVNTKTCDIFGYTKSEFKNIKFSEICHPDDKVLVIKEITNIISGKTNSFSIKSRFFNKSGKIIYTEIYGKGIYENNELKSIYHSMLDVTKQTTTTLELIKSENKYKSLFNNSTYGILLFDYKHRKLLEVNKKLLQIVGCKNKAQLMQYSYTSFLEPVHIDGSFMKDVLVEVEEKVKRQKQFSINFKIKKTGQAKTIYAKASFYPLPAKNENIFSVVLESIDKEIKLKTTLNDKNLSLIRFKKALRESKNKYLKIFNNSIPLIIIDKQLALIEVNGAFSKLINFNKNEVIGKPVSRFIYDNDIKNAITFFSSSLKKTAAKKDFRVKLQQKNGSIIETNFHVTGINIENKLPQKLLITVTNLNEFNLLNKQLLTSNTYLQVVLNNSFTSVNRLDLNGNLLFDNRTFQDSFKNSKKDFGDKPIWESDMLNGLPQEQEKLKKQIKLITKNKKTIVDQIFYKKEDDKYGYLKYALKYIKANNQNAWLLLESIDVTDLVSVKTQLASAVKEFDGYVKSNLELEKFAFVASHDLKEPIRNIMSFTQLLGLKLENNDDKELKQYLSFILNATKSLNKLVNGIIEYSKFENQSTKLTSISVKLLLKESLKHFQNEIKLNKVKIKIEKTPVKIIGDKIQLLQLFKNLISNAIKFSSKNRPAEIVISGTANETEYKFTIKDNGIGIPKKYYKQIFLPFKKVKDNNEEGVGLGLKLAQKIVNNHGGKVWVESKVNDGSSFHFTIKKH